MEYEKGQLVEIKHLKVGDRLIEVMEVEGFEKNIIINIVVLKKPKLKDGIWTIVTKTDTEEEYLHQQIVGVSTPQRDNVPVKLYFNFY